jgi:hypothetical protein
MLTLVVKGDEFFNEETETFESLGDVTLELEHSLISLSKWESKFQKPFLSATNTMTSEEVHGYINAMVLTPVFPPEVLTRLTPDNLMQINAYIESPESATTFGELPSRRGRGEVITSELIYYWLVTFNIPFEVENWHLNRLFSLVRICNMKNDPNPKKMSRHEIAARNRELNMKRRKELNTTG